MSGLARDYDNKLQVAVGGRERIEEAYRELQRRFTSIQASYEVPH